MNRKQLAAAFDELKQEATQLAGGLNDLSQRATVYHHIFLDSGRNHAFPLIAAHGALWARGYFRFGTQLAKVLSLQFVFSSHVRRERLAQMNAFADTFRDINRRVCIDTYTMPIRQTFCFKNFANRDERIERGLRAFAIASETGWDKVEDKLADYKMLPASFFESPVDHFQAIRASLIS
jgi:hypothetical protein